MHALELLQSLPGPRDYVVALFQRPVVQKDQWEVEMWCRSGYAYTGESRLDLMVQRTIQRTLAIWQQRLGRMPWLGVIRDGAHAIPRLIGASTTV